MSKKCLVAGVLAYKKVIAIRTGRGDVSRNHSQQNKQKKSSLGDAAWEEAATSFCPCWVCALETSLRQMPRFMELQGSLW